MSGTTLHNLRAVDGGEQFVKVNPEQRAVCRQRRRALLVVRADGRRAARRAQQLLHRRHRHPPGARLADLRQPLQRVLVQQRPVRARHPRLDRQPRHARRSQRHRQLGARHRVWPGLVGVRPDVWRRALWRRREHRTLRWRDHQQFRRRERRAAVREWRRIRYRHRPGAIVRNRTSCTTPSFRRSRRVPRRSSGASPTRSASGRE